MRIDLGDMQGAFLSSQGGRKSRHSVSDRSEPSILQYDYLTLSTLGADVRSLIAALPRQGGRALDLGADKSPYRAALEEHGFAVETLDVTREGGADHAGTVESTGLPGSAFDLVLCTQVLEHCDDPWQGVREIHRILVPGGCAIISAPHVWFFHPHPTDHWRFTQQGLTRLCEQGGFRVTALFSQGGSVLAAAQVANFLVYGVLGRLGAPLYALANLAGRFLDRLVRNDLFCINFACLVERK
jgi:SAM-dependent methyltransferase